MQLFCLRRVLVGEVRETNARSVFADAEVPHAIQNFAVFVQKEQVPVPSHQLDDEPEGDRVEELVLAVERKRGDAVHADLLDRGDAAADQMLP